MAVGKPLRWILAALGGAAIGAASAWWSTGEGAAARVPGHPAWTTDRGTGSTDANPWTRARIARIGLMALNRNEAVYYIADRDDEGRPLREHCQYTVQGGALPGAWWSLTLYAQDRFLARNTDDAHSVAATTAQTAAAWQVSVGQQPMDAGERLSNRGAGNFTLALRVYRPTQALIDDPHAIALPRVHRQACRT